MEVDCVKSSIYLPKATHELSMTVTRWVVSMTELWHLAFDYMSNVITSNWKLHMPPLVLRHRHFQVCGNIPPQSTIAVFSTTQLLASGAGSEVAQSWVTMFWTVSAFLFCCVGFYLIYQVTTSPPCFGLNPKGCKNGIHCLPAWHTVFGFGIGGLNRPIILQLVSCPLLSQRAMGQMRRQILTVTRTWSLLWISICCLLLSESRWRTTPDWIMMTSLSCA